MSKILPFVLKKLRKTKGLSQEQLADRAKIDKQTIFRLEREQGAQTTRERTVQQIARALNTEPGVLTGEAPLPDTRDEPVWGMSKFSFLTSATTHNAFFLISQRYDVSHQEVVELAPFLFCCVAEMCLRQRRDRLRKAEIACENARNAELEIPYLAGTDFSQSHEIFAAEKESIDFPDLFGYLLGDYDEIDDRTTHNPFARFLKGLTNETTGTAEFDGYDRGDWPRYRVCIEEAKKLADSDDQILEDIFEGHVPLKEMPKEIRESFNPKKQADWVRAKRDEYQKKWTAYAAKRISEEENS